MKKAESADFPRFEAEVLKRWDQEETFQQSLKLRQGQELFSFYDGPPFANGKPHYGHTVPWTIKDAVARYKTMRGFYVPRVAGWDTHGLPVEYEVEKAMGIAGKRQILEIGVEKFNQACRDSVFKYKNEIEEFMHRLGRWVDLEHAYATLDDDYIESVWWVFSELYKKGLVYQGFRSMPYCPRCATPLSNFELNQGYQDGVADPSVYVKFKLKSDDRELLAWTTTPWTLPANSALAVDPEADYVTVELNSDGDGWKAGEKLILAKQRLGELDLRQADYKVVKTEKGQSLVGLEYVGLYPAQLKPEEEKTVWRVYADDSVSLEDGTGVLHVAPRYGETDLTMGQREGLPLIESVDAFGKMTKIEALEQVEGMFFKEADPLIVEELTKKGRIFAAETFTHTYPFCWRCDSPLLYFAISSWFVAVTKIGDDLIKTNRAISWVPAHIKDGRFGNWLADARDWGISRNRFWGSPLPIWVNESDPEDRIVVGSLAELRELSGQGEFDLHRPGIDNVVFKRDGKTYKRVEEVFDCWFESGSMPYASVHYPFEHEAEFEAGFPADFISEGLDQTRGWFYTLHVLATALKNQPAYQNVICHGIVVAADGRKLSKRLKNYPPLDEVFNTYGADILRFFMLSSPAMAGEAVRFGQEALKDTQRNVFMTLWNVYSFLTTYAEIDKWQPPKQLAEPKSDNLLDQWMLARLNQTIAEVTKQADQYQIARAVRPIAELIDDLSNWYVRRSRRRFWKSEDDNDKQSAYVTLHYTLCRIAQLMAPWSPFVSDKLWRELTAGMDEAKSVHLSDWPKAGKYKQDLLSDMNNVRDVIRLGLARRAQAGIKVRQPLALATLVDVFNDNSQAATLSELVKDELNVKAVKVLRSGDLSEAEQKNLWKDGLDESADEGFSVGVLLDTNITPELKQEGMVRDLIRLIQTKRKEAGLEVDDRIELMIGTKDEELRAAAGSFDDLIKQETLATTLVVGEKSDSVPVRVAGEDVTIDLKKAA